jgi:hypothetical protein
VREAVTFFEATIHIRTLLGADDDELKTLGELQKERSFSRIVNFELIFFPPT